MYTTIFFWAAIVLSAIQMQIFLSSLFFYKYLYPRVFRPRFKDAKDEEFPQVHLFVPIKGASENTERILRSFATQEYPAPFKISIITDPELTPGTVIAQQVAADYEHVRHITAPFATRCSQKNQNLLSGMEDDHTSEVFAFADADVLAGPNWLRGLISPLTMGKHWLSSGLPTGTITSTKLSHLLEGILTSYQAKTLMSYNALWGGSYAVWRETFEELGAREFWSNIAVDDISLFQLIQRYNLKNLWNRSKPRIRVLPMPDLDLEMFTSIESISGVLRWFTRQIIYIKYHRRPIWYLAVWANFGHAMLMCLTPLLLLFGESQDMHRAGLIGLAFCLFLFVINMSLPLIRNKMEVSLWHWAKPSFIIGDIIANIALQWSLPLSYFIWARIHYKLASDGRVIEVIHPDEVLKAASEGKALEDPTVRKP